MRIQKAENVNKALEFITSRGVKLTNIGPEGRQQYHLVEIQFTLIFRHYRWEPEAHTRNDMDSHFTIHDCGYQARVIITIFFRWSLV